MAAMRRTSVALGMGGPRTGLRQQRGAARRGGLGFWEGLRLRFFCRISDDLLISLISLYGGVPCACAIARTYGLGPRTQETRKIMSMNWWNRAHVES